MTPLWRNPEFIRNCRAQLRPRRLLLVASIVAALSLVVGYSVHDTYSFQSQWAVTLLTIALYAQLFTLCLGGGYACMRSVSQEREQNTFDFQRVTQLTSLELALGKLFGAPAISWFAALCMCPAALVGAFSGGSSPSRIAAAYLILVLGSIAVQALMLVVSLGATRQAGGFSGLGAVFLLFIFLMFTNSPEPSRAFFDLGIIGPAAAGHFARYGTWGVVAASVGSPPQLISLSPWTDVFFGVPLHHVPVLLVLYLTFTAWCLLALARNLKKDPDLFELLSPAQSVGLLCYLNLILVGFFLVRRTYDGYPQGSQTASSTFEFFLITNLVLLYCLGLALLRNREQTRRRAYQTARAGFDWLEFGWPTLYVLAGAAVATLLVLARFAFVPGLQDHLNRRFAAFQAALLLATVLRDLCFLQWMNLRRSRRPLILGVILLGVFYTCGGILLGVANFSDPVKNAISAILIPWPLAFAGHGNLYAKWFLNPGPWLIGLAVQLALVVLFAALHYKSTEELRPAAIAAPAGAPAPGD